MEMTMNVTDVTVRFMRRAQIREYEPIEAEVSLKAALAEGEDYVKIANTLMADAKKAVHESGLKSSASTDKATTATAPAPAPAADAPKPRGRPPSKPAAAAPAPAPADDFDDPAPVNKPAAPAPAPAPAADFDDMTASPAPAPAAAPAATMTLKELQVWTNANIEGNKITIDQVKGVWQTFGCSRSSELKPEQYGEARAKIEAIIAANGK
jgi:hypothetical protein